MNRSALTAFVFLASVMISPSLSAAGSGLNVLIVVNQNSTNSVQLGNYYRELRHVPPQNFLRINWAGGNIEWTQTDFNVALLNPLNALLASAQLTNQIDYIVLSMDIPYRVHSSGNGDNSTTSSLFYGFKPDSRDLNTCPLAPGSTNLYSGSEGLFRSTPPINATSNSYLVTMITSSNLALAKQIVDHGVISDGTFPSQKVILGKSGDEIRNLRFEAFDNAVFNTRLRGNYNVERADTCCPGINLLGYQNGIYGFPVPPNAFVPGSMADNLTSFAGQILTDPAGQTTMLPIFAGGAAGSFGTVIEPCAYPQKFPDPQNYFYQARGFSLAECYYQSVTNPYQGMVMGEPLAAPFARSGTGSWTGLQPNSPLSGTTNLTIHFTAADAQHPLQQVDLFLDGKWLKTVTNIAPAQGNVLKATVNGSLVSFTVPAGATVKSVANGLATALNNASGQTKAQAILHGDRIELQSTDSAKSGSQVSLAVDTSAPSGVLTTYLTSTGASFLDSIAWGIRGYSVSGSLIGLSSLSVTVTRTNGQTATLTLNNNGAASLFAFVQQFVDLINTNTSPSLQGADGLIAQDLIQTSTGGAVFNLRARSTGYPAAMIKANVSGSLGPIVTPVGNNALTENLGDLQPRAHVYVSAGVTDFPLTFPVDTTALPDGTHELTAVAYEGNHVRTQTRASQQVEIHNTPLSATFTSLLGGTNTAREATLQFRVVANTNTIASIELFGTGGSLGLVSNQSTAMFSIPAASLDLGLHPFYAIITRADGRQYRTETMQFRLVGTETPFSLKIGAPPPTLAWVATAGRSYEVLSSSTINGTFTVRDTVIPTNSLAQWVESNPSAAQLFYRVRVLQ